MSSSPATSEPWSSARTAKSRPTRSTGTTTSPDTSSVNYLSRAFVGGLWGPSGGFFCLFVFFVLFFVFVLMEAFKVLVEVFFWFLVGIFGLLEWIKEVSWRF